MLQVQFCKFKGVRNWSCCLVLELLSLWTSWRCFWDLTICCCSLLSINMNCPPPARTASKLSGTKEFEKMVNSPGILDYTQHMMPHEIQSLGLPSLKPRLPGPLEHNFLRPIKVQGPQLTGTSWVRWLYQESIHIRPAGDIKTVLFMEKVVHRFMVLKVSWRLLSLWPQKDTIFIAQWELVLSA